MKMNKFQKHCSNALIATALMLCVGGFTSCFDSDDVGDAYYTFTGMTVTNFLEQNPGIFGEFYKALDTTGVDDLLSTYGTFTVFAPTNDAMKAYYADSNVTSMEEFLADKTYGDSARFNALKQMVFFQLISTKTYMESEFPESGRFDHKNMMDRYISITYRNETGQLEIIVNGSSKIVLKDQDVHNGVVHGVDRVLVPSNFMLPEFIKTDSRYSMFAEALYWTGLSELLLRERDETYKQTNKDYPDERLYNYTAFVEPNEVYEAAGITSVSGENGDYEHSMLAYAKKVYDPLYPQYAHLTDVTDRNHPLNRFIAYHLLDYWIWEGGFMYKVGSYDYVYWPESQKGEGVVEYLFPMAENTMIEVKEELDREIYDIVPVFNKKPDGSCVRWVKQVAMGDMATATNGIMHEIDNILVFDQEVQNEVFTKRLRIDVYSTLPEMMNANLRPQSSSAAANKDIKYPAGFFENLQYKDATVVENRKFNGGSVQYQGGSFYISGNFDFTQKLPALPEGTWEFRVGTKLRNDIPYIVQIYVDGMPIGIPLDVGKDALTNQDIGVIFDVTYAEEYGYEGSSADKAKMYREEILKGKPNENDKDLRNRGWMKAPDSFHSVGGDAGGTARDDKGSMRSILGRYDFGPGINHTLRIKSVGTVGTGTHPFVYDYLEFMPTSMLEGEDIY